MTAKPTICARCKHIQRNANSEKVFNAPYRNAECACAFEASFDFVTGEPEMKPKKRDYTHCAVRNETGECPDYEAKETE